MKKKHIQYSNPTIVEAVIEIRFQTILSVSDTLKIEKKLGAKYPIEKDELVHYKATVSPEGMALQQDKLGQYRIKLKINNQIIIQIFPDKFSFHWIGKYPGWSKFDKEFHHFWKIFYKLHPRLLAKQIGVRFINQINYKTIDQEVGYWLKSSPNFPQNIRNSVCDYFFVGKWPIAPERWAQVNIAEGISNNDSKPLIFDIDVFNILKNPVKTETLISKITSELHEQVYEIFNSSTSAHYEKLLNSISETV